MEFVFLLTARASVALVLGVSGAAKLADRAGSRQAMVDFGVPAALSAPLGLSLPIVELAIALALLPSETANGAAAGAFVLFLGLSLAVGWNLIRGRRPDCHCFGRLRSRPVGAGTLLRNGFLLGLAAWIFARPAPAWRLPAGTWLGALTPPAIVGLSTLALLGLGVVAQGWLLFHLLRQNGRLLVRVDALERLRTGERAAAVPEPTPAGIVPTVRPGMTAPAFELPSFEGAAVSLDLLLAPGPPVLLVFVDPECGPCQTLLPDVAEWQRTLAGILTIAVLTRGSEEAYRKKVAPLGVTGVLRQRDGEVAARYGATGTPSAILVNPQGRIAAPLTSGAGDIRRLVQGIALREPWPGVSPRGLPVGSPAPAVRLTALDGTAFDVGDRIGEPAVLLFWNVGCGFCRRMLDDLRAWERMGSRNLVLVASGDREANADLGLQSPVLIDPEFATGKVFGASATPSAVLIGPDGTIASPLVVGAPQVMQLLRAADPRARPVTAPASPPIPSPR